MKGLLGRVAKATKVMNERFDGKTRKGNKDKE